MKPFKGRITNYHKVFTPIQYRHSEYYGLGYYYLCEFLDHPLFAGKRGYTSNVVKEEGNIIETLNSRYELVPSPMLSAEEQTQNHLENGGVMTS